MMQLLTGIINKMKNYKYKVFNNKFILTDFIVVFLTNACSSIMI